MIFSLVSRSRCGGERADERPQQLVSHVLVEKHQILERFFLNDPQRPARVDDGIGAAGGIVDERHLPEVVAASRMASASSPTPGTILEMRMRPKRMT